MMKTAAKTMPAAEAVRQFARKAIKRAGTSTFKDAELAYLELHIPLLLTALLVIMMPGLDSKYAACLMMLIALPLCEFLWGAFAASVEKEERRREVMSKTRRPSGPEARLIIDAGFMPEVCCVLHSSYQELVFTDRLEMQEAIHIDKTTKKVWREMIESA